MKQTYTSHRSTDIYTITDPYLSGTDLRPAPAARAQQYTTTLANQFAALPMAVLNDLRAGKLTYRDVCLYCYLLVKQGKNESLHWTIESLTILTGIAETGVKESMQNLRKAGHIQRKKVGLRTHTVCLTRVQPGKGKGGILIKGQSSAEFLKNEPTPPLKKSPLKSRAARKTHVARNDASQMSDDPAGDDGTEDFDFGSLVQTMDKPYIGWEKDRIHPLLRGGKPVGRPCLNPVHKVSSGGRY